MTANDLTIQLNVKQTLWSNVTWSAILILCRLNLVSLKTAVNIINFTLRNGAFKYKISNGKWEKLVTDIEVTID